MKKDLKTLLVKRLRQVGAYDVRIADPKCGFDKAISGRHPLELWGKCRSIVVFALPMSPRTNNVYLGPYSPWKEKNRNLGPVPIDIQSKDYAMDRLARLFLSSVTFKGIQFLTEKKFQVSFAKPQAKLCAFESGLGVYGRSGLILHPKLGNRMSIGVIMTDAKLEFDTRLEGYEPCRGCDQCIQICPAKAFDSEKKYPQSWSKEICTKKRAEIAQKGLFCHNCFTVCPAGNVSGEDLFCIREADSFYDHRRK
jgi:epoxyqueuosine reductase QueG